MGVEKPYPLREQQVSASILRAVLDSEGLRSWLVPQIHAKKQAPAGQWLGVAQSTINRIVNQDVYDFPLDTVTRIASTLGFARLSDFVLHVENELAGIVGSSGEKDVRVPQNPNRHAAVSDKESLIIQEGGIHGDRPVSSSELRHVVTAIIRDIATGFASSLALKETTAGTSRPPQSARHAPKRKAERRAARR